MTQTRINTASTQIGIHEVYCIECGAETELDCICDDLNFADGDRMVIDGEEYVRVSPSNEI